MLTLMKIAFISYWSCPLTRLGVLTAGGMNVYVLNLANNLGFMGHQVDIFTRSHRENDEKILSTHKNVRIIHLNGLRDNLYEDILPFAEKICAFMQKFSSQYDILHAHYYYSGLIGLILKGKLSVPLVATFHALGIMKELYGGKIDKRRINSEKKIAKYADGVVSSIELERKELITNYQADGKKIFTVPLGVNHHVFRKIDKTSARKKVDIPQKQKIILFVGRIDPIKGISLLIEAVYMLSLKFSNFENNFRVLLIGGDIQSRNFWRHPEVVKIQMLIEKLDLACCVKFIGSKPHSLLPYYYSGSDIVIMPSKHESFGLVVLEAMASGAAVIASKVGGLSYLIKDNETGRFFKSGDSSDLSKIIWELLNDDGQRNRLGKNAIMESKKYCWDIQAMNILEIYKKLI